MSRQKNQAPHLNVPLFSMRHKCTQESHVLPIKRRVKPMLIGFEDNTFATETCLHCAMLYKEGY
jgi:hypothetical protein